MSESRSSPRWPRAQRFELSGYGRTIVAAYRSRIRAVGARGDHAIFEHARNEWAEQYELLPDDGVYLAEIEDGPRTLAQLSEVLAACHQSREDVAKSVGRLVDARLVVALA